MPFELTSPAFASSSTVPARFTCDGEDVSPPLVWTDPPSATRGFALIVEDPDAPAGIWAHWVLHGIGPAVRALPEGASGKALPAGSTEATNSWGRIGYRGPCPPKGRGTHRYVFRLFALDADVDLGPRATRETVLEATDGHVLSEARFVCRYTRP
jgi:Raf kinase inhibitor-like YbhB/YbcL family protein